MAKQCKRTIEEVDAPEASSAQRNIKHKTDFLATESNNSDTSYVSAAAAIFSESDSDDNKSAADTAETSIEQSGSEISSSEVEDSSDESSSAEDSDEGEEEEEDITIVRPGVKPEIKRVEGGGGGLLERLRTFLPELEVANRDLERAAEDGTLGERSLEFIEEGDGPYIEMVCPGY
jgi:hypothetical protein